MDHFQRDRFGQDGVVFVMASDDPAWCHEHFGDNDSVTILDDNMRNSDSLGVGGDTGTSAAAAATVAALDLAVLSMTDHMILTVGTFGYWAAYLSGGEVVYYKDAILLNHPTNANQIQLEDYYPSTWIGISDG